MVVWCSQARIVVVAVTVVALVGGCGRDDPAGSDQPAPADHQAELAIGENDYVTRFVVPVDGYSYDNDYAGAIENVQASLEAVDEHTGIDDFGAVSLHSVVADDPSQNTAQVWNGEWEVGYLMLVQFNTPIRHDLDASWNSLAMLLSFGDTPYEAIDELDLSDTKVFVFETPDLPNSRFHYVWLDHGVGGILDGADRASVERWLAAYFAVPKLAPRETPDLAERLVAIPGYRYSNVDPERTTEFEQVPAPEVPHSFHFVTHASGPLGMLVLSPSAHADEIRAWMRQTADFEETDSVDVGGHRIDALAADAGAERQILAYTWDDGAYAGVFMTVAGFERDVLAYVEAFLDAR